MSEKGKEPYESSDRDNTEEGCKKDAPGHRKREKGKIAHLTVNRRRSIVIPAMKALLGFASPADSAAS